MINKLRIIYDDVEDTGEGIYIVTLNGLKGAVGPEGLIVPLRFHNVKITANFITGHYSAGIGYIAVYDKTGRLLVPEDNNKNRLVELRAMAPWNGKGLILIIKESSFVNENTLILLRQNSEKKVYKNVDRMPLFIRGTNYLAVLTSKDPLGVKTPDFSISREDCLTALNAGLKLEVLDDCFNSILL